MPWLTYLLAILLGYLLGSLPFGYLLGRLKGVDVRKHGSGRTGGTNVYRALGAKYGALTGAGDLLKGSAAVLLARLLFADEAAAALAGAFAVFGHNWSVFLGFRGGAGGGTGAGAILFLNPLAGMITVPIFLVVLFVGRYASVATMTVGLGSVVVLAVCYLLGWPTLLGFPTPAGHILFGLLAALGIVWSLRPNIGRLLAGTEKRIEFKSARRQA